MPAASKITVFPEWAKPDAPLNLDLEDIAERIRTGQDCLDIITQIRAEPDGSAIKKLKDQLPCYMFTGEFTYRAESHLTRPSGLAIFDFDSKPDKGLFVPDIDFLLKHYAGISLVPMPKEKHYALVVDDAPAFRDSLFKLPYVVLAFVSPSGKGVKAILRVPAERKTYAGHYEALLGQFRIADSSSRNIGRVCYASYDPDVRFRPFEEAKEYIGYIVPDERVAQERPTNWNPKFDFSLLNLPVNQVRQAVDGHRHETLLRAARLAGGFIGAGLLPEKMVEDALVDAYGTPKDPQYRPINTIRDGITNGKLVPIYDTRTEVIVQDGAGNNVAVVMPVDASTSSLISVNDVWPEMENQFEFGVPRGEPTYFDALADYFTILPGEKTLLTGLPSDGKSELMKQIILSRALYAGQKWAVFSPEDATPSRYFFSLIEMLVGLSADKAYDNRMSGDQFVDAAQWLHEHVKFVGLKTAKTHKAILTEFKRAIEYEGVTAIVEDPFNRINLNSKFNRDDERISEYMDTEQDFAQYHKVASFTVLHPKGDIKPTSTGENPVIGPYTLAGGAMWNNKTDNLLSAHRPYRVNNPSDRSFDFHSLKIRLKKTVGQEGKVSGVYDYWSRRHYFNDQNPLDNPSNPFNAKVRKRPGLSPTPAIEFTTNAKQLPKEPDYSTELPDKPDPFIGQSGYESFND